MNVLARAAMTVEQFLRWEERQELRFEFDGVRPLAMTGGTQAHSLIQVGLLSALAARLRGTPCRVHGSPMKLELEHSVRYPDAFVACAAQVPEATSVTAPVVVFEILSPNTVEHDLVTKNVEYRATPSVQRYVVLEQAQIGAMIFRRHGDLWISELRSGADAILDMPEIGVSLPLGEIYADVTFAEPAP